MSLSIGTLTGRLELDDQFSGAVDKAADGMSALEKGLAVLGTGFAAVTAAATATGAAVVALASHGSDVDDITSQFEQLAQKVGLDVVSSMNQLRAGSAGTVSDMELMKSSLTLLRMGFSGSAEDMGVMAKAARVLAEGGMPLTQAYEMITRALTTGQPKMLARLGININLADATDKLRQAAEKEGGVVDDVALKHAKSAEILKGLNKFVQESATVTDDFNDKTAQASVRWTNFYDQLSRTVTNLPSVASAFDRINAAVLGALGKDPEKLMASIVSAVDWAATKVGDFGVAVVETFVGLRREVEPVLIKVGTLLKDIWITAQLYVEKFAGVLVTVLLGAIRGIVEIVDKMVDGLRVMKQWFEDLPAPVKVLATDVGVLAAAAWGLNAALVALTGSTVVAGVTSLTGSLAGLAALAGKMGWVPALLLMLKNVGAATGATATLRGISAAATSVGGALTLGGTAGLVFTDTMLRAATGGQTFVGVQNSIATALGHGASVTTDATFRVEQMTDEQRRMAAEQKKWSDETKAVFSKADAAISVTNENIEKLVDSFTGADLARSAKDMEQAWQSLSTTAKKDADVQDRVLLAYEGVRGKLKTLPPALEALWKSEEKALEAHKKQQRAFDSFSATNYTAQMKQGELATLGFVQKAVLLGTNLESSGVQAGAASGKLGVLSQGWDKFSQQAVSTAWVTQGAWSLIPNTVEGVVDAYTGAFTSIGSGMKKFRDDQKATAEAAKKAGVDIVSAVSGAISRIPQTLQAALQGGGGILGALKSIGVQMADALSGSLFDQLAKKMAESGWMKSLSKALAGGVGGWITGLAGAAFAVFKITSDASKAYTDKINAAIKESIALLQQTGREFDDLAAQVETPLPPIKRTQVELEKWIPTLKTIIELEGQVRDTQEQIANAEMRLAELQQALVPTWDDVKAALDKYGISVDGVGQKVQQLAITAAATEMINDWELLARAGADAGAVAKGMSEKVNKLIADSTKYGSVIPDNMKPVLEAMLKQGLLLDGAGNKMKDLTGIKFGAPVKSEADIIHDAMAEVVDVIKDLKDTLAELVDKIKGLVTPSEEAAKQIHQHWEKAPWEDWPAPTFPGEVPPSETNNPTPGYAGGGTVFSPRGSDTVPAMLTPGERVLTVAENRSYGKGGGTAVINVNGRFFAELIVPELPGVVQEYALGGN